MLNMVTSIDGATTVEGGSTGLSDDDDRKLFHALRSVADVLLVGAGTIRAENYRPATNLYVVSGSLDLDPDARVFGDRTKPVTVLSLADADPARVEALSEVAEVVLLPVLDGKSIVGALPQESVVLCEGGPTLNGPLATDNVIDEINWTISPLVASGESHRMVVGDEVVPATEFELKRIWQGKRSLFLRYLKPSL